MSNIILPSNPADHKAIMSAMVEIDGAMIRAAAEKDYIKSSIADLAAKYQLDKKHLTKFARLYHKQQFQDNLAICGVIERPLFEHPAPRAPEWQPIATAPKDGTRVLIKGDCTVVANWGRVTSIVGLIGHGWQIVKDAYMPEHIATHWMHLPKPPMAAARGE